MTYPLSLAVNGVRYSLAVAGARTLLSVLRGDVGLTGTDIIGTTVGLPQRWQFSVIPAAAASTMSGLAQC